MATVEPNIPGPVDSFDDDYSQRLFAQRTRDNDDWLRQQVEREEPRLREQFERAPARPGIPSLERPQPTIERPAAPTPAEGRGPLSRAVSDIGIGTTEAGKQVLGGFFDLARNTLNVVTDLENFQASVMGVDPLFVGGPGDLLVPAVDPAKSVTGGLVRSATQFLGAFLPLTKAVRAMGVAGELTQSTVAGALADALAFDPRQPRLSNMLNELAPELRNPLTDYLAADPADTAAVGRFKNAIEGLPLGMGTDAVKRGMALAGDAMRQAILIRRRLQLERLLPQETKVPGAFVMEEASTAAIKVPRGGEPQLINLAGMAEAMGANLIDSLWSKVQAGEILEAGQPSTILQAAKLVRGLGRLQTRDEFATFAREVQGIKDSTAGNPSLFQSRMQELVQRSSGREPPRPQIGEVPGASVMEEEATVTGAAKPADDLGLEASITEYLKSAERPTPRLKEPRPGALAEESPGKLNIARIDASDQFREVAARLNERLKRSGEMTQALPRRGFAEIEARARGALTVEQLASWPEGAAMNAEQLVAARNIRDAGLAYVEDLKIRVKAGDAEARQWLQPATIIAGKLEKQRARASYEAALGLSSHRIPSTGVYRAEDISAIADLVEGADQLDPDRLVMMLDAAKTEARKAVLLGKIADAKERGSLDLLADAWMQYLLSNPMTHIVNNTSSALTTLLGLGERTLAVAMSSGGGPGVQAAEPLQYAYGLIMGVRKAWKATSESLRTGEATEALSKLEIVAPKITAEQLDRSGMMGRGLHYLYEVLRLGGIPGRLLVAEDAFWRTINTSAELEVLALRHGMAEGLTGRPLAARMAQLVEDPPKGLLMQARQWGDYQTFNNMLLGSREGGGLVQSLGKGIMALRDAHPLFKFLAPFVRTPTNILNYSLERTPGVNLLLSQVREDLIAGGARADLAKAKTATGALIMMTASSLAAEGYITGEGPADPTIRRLWELSGWKPWSIKIGNTFYSYNRLDPIGAMLGIAATYSEMVSGMSHAEAEELALAGTLAITKSLLSKTYLTGIANVFEAISDQERSPGHVFRQFAGSFVPAVVGQVERTLDPTLSEVRTLADQFRSRIPGLSGDVPPRRGLRGEPIDDQPGLGHGFWPAVYRNLVPMSQSTQTLDPVYREIMQNNMRIEWPPSDLIARSYSPRGVQFAEAREQEQVRLTPQQRDELTLEITQGKGRDGKTLGERLEHDMQGRRYQDLSKGPNGGRTAYVQDMMSLYREAAEQRFLQRHPEIQEKLVERLGTKIIQRLPEARQPGARERLREDIIRGIGIGR